MNSLDTKQIEDFVVERLTECQSALYAYIYSLTADSNQAWDVLQETNRVIWKHAADFDMAREFLPWAKAFAFNQVRTARKTCQRDRLVFHDESTLHDISNQWNRDRLPSVSDKTVALERCLGTLSVGHRDLIERFYAKSETLAEIATTLGKKANSVAVKLHRIRQQLAGCIQARLNAHD